MGAEEWLPERRTLPALREAAEDCRGCDLYKNATQTVFGEGTRTAQAAHPASVLRARKPDRDEARNEFFADIERAAEYLGKIRDA